MNQFPPSSRVSLRLFIEFFRKFAEIFASQGALPVSTTPVANFSTIVASVFDTGGKFATVQRYRWQICHWCQRRRWQTATGINDTGGKFATGVNNTGGKQWEQLSNC
jgi:hypothetical protein